MATGFYARLRETAGHDDLLAACVDRLVNKLEAISTTGDRPGMLLGKIQSGKTRGFIGAIARAFDGEFDIAVVLTKGTKTLSAQTVARLRDDFREFIDKDQILLLDIMALPGNLTRSELRRKIIVVAKKQAQNLEKLIAFLGKQQALAGRRVLIIDDEADLASVRFVRKKGDPDIKQGTIAEQIDTLRSMTEGVAILQVTATPYSLYLQPDDYEDIPGHYVFLPKKPAFTELLPIHDKYVGGDHYFGDFDEDDYRRYLYVEVDSSEQDALRKADRRRISQGNVLETSNTAGLRRAIMSFILGVCIRRWQQTELGETPGKYAMIIHNDTQKASQQWQADVVEWIFEAIADGIRARSPLLRAVFNESFNDLATSIATQSGKLPDRDLAYSMMVEAIEGDEVVKEVVNSDNDVMALLDEKAELKLRTGFNIFIGGNILDRGITIPKLIAFYYGRNPKKMQADTVLQHSRMYGNRHPQDLLVTRFHTSQAVYTRLSTINTFENALRKAFENDTEDKGVVFLEADPTDGIRPCAPNKVLLSDVVAVDPQGALLPQEFDTKSGKEMTAAQARLDALIKPEWRDTEDFHILSIDAAYEIIDEIEKTLVFDDVPFEWRAMKGLIKYYLEVHGDRAHELLVIAATGRKLDREASGEKSGRSVMGSRFRDLVLDHAHSNPVLVLLQQEGSRDPLHWSGNQKFWWPVLVAPASVEPCVFASKTMA